MKRWFMLFLALIVLLISGMAGAQAARPGETPPPGKLELMMKAGFIFPSALSSCAAGIVNPEDSSLLLRYALTIEPEELARVSGMIAGDSKPILLYQSDPVMPGEEIKVFGLNTLPGGALLPEGQYRAVMTVTSVDGRSGLVLNSEFAVQVFVWVMASQVEARADERGMLDLNIYNGTDAPARYALIIRAEEFDGPHGIDISELGERHSFALIALSDTLLPMQKTLFRLHLLPAGTTLPPGPNEAWLVRLRQGEDPYAGTRVLLDVPDFFYPLAVPPALPAAMEELAQAVVNAEYLLGLQ